MGGVGKHFLSDSTLLDDPYLVTLKALSSLMHRRTERPTGGISSWLTSTNSMIELTTTTKSNLKVLK